MFLANLARVRHPGRLDDLLVSRLVGGLRNTSRFRLRQFARAAAAEGTSSHFKVLDAGAGAAPYRRLFDHVSYATADFGKVSQKVYGPLDYQCDLTAIPVPAGSFDLVLCTQVMEHVPDPEAVLAEFNRILRRRGQVWLTAPFSYAEHEAPYDFQRFTRFAWRRLARRTGFQVREITGSRGTTRRWPIRLGWPRPFSRAASSSGGCCWRSWPGE